MKRSVSAVIVLASLVLASLALYPQVAVADAVDVPQKLLAHTAPTPPPAPKTIAQIASEAYAIEAQARLLAGRKTDSSLDGTGGVAIDRTTLDTTTAQFDQGTHNRTVATSNRVVLLSSDDFNDGVIAQFWLLAGSNYWTERTSGQGAGELVMVAGGGSLDAFNSLRYVSVGSSDYNISVDYTPYLDPYGNGCQFQNLSVSQAAPTSFDDADPKVGVKVIRQCGGPNTNTWVEPWYRTTAGGIRWWDGNSWETTPTLIQATRTSMDDRFRIFIQRTATDYKFFVYRAVDTTNVLSATIAVATVRNGASADWYGIGYRGTGDGGFAIGFYDNWNFSPGFPDGTFQSRPHGFGAWDSILRKVACGCQGTFGIQVRYSNNSDMTNPSGWRWVANNTDVLTLNLQGGFFQYTVYLNTSITKLADITFTYSGKSFGAAPSKDKPGVLDTNTLWANVALNLQYYQAFDLDTGEQFTWTIQNSNLSFGGRDGILRVNDSTLESDPDPAGRVDIIIKNSTLYDASRFFLMDTIGYLSGWFRVFMDNATLKKFNSTLLVGAGQGTLGKLFIEDVHDTDVLEYNRAPTTSYVALSDGDPFPVRSMKRVYARGTNPQYGNVATPLNASYNFMEGGFNQLVWARTAVGPGVATEYANWSNNYIANSTHTALGVYGQDPASKFGLSLSGGYYITLYRNYINTSKYIVIQTGGNMSNIRIIENYLRGPSPSFTLPIGIISRTHNVTIERNHIWDMNSTNNRGITVGDFSYDILIDRNIVYDVGVWHINIGGLGLKWIGAVESSDYSWKDVNVTVSNNYLSGAWFNPAYLQDSGYVKAYNNTIVNVSPLQDDIFMSGGWDDLENNTYAWLDWHGGYVDFTNLDFYAPGTYCYLTSAPPWCNEDDVWVRYFRDNTITVVGAPGGGENLEVTEASGKYGLTYWCSGLTPAQQLAWVGRSCVRKSDMANYTFTGPSKTRSVEMPHRWFNKTLSLTLDPKAVLQHDWRLFEFAEILDATRGTMVAYTSGSVIWDLEPGHQYVLEYLIRIEVFSQILISVMLIVGIAIILFGVVRIIVTRFDRFKEKGV